MGVSYMKMEERDRLIREEGELKGEIRGEIKGKTPLISIIRRKAANGLNAAAIAELLEIGQEEIDEVLSLEQEHSDWTDFQIAEALVRRK